IPASPSTPPPRDGTSKSRARSTPATRATSPSCLPSSSPRSSAGAPRRPSPPPRSRSTRYSPKPSRAPASLDLLYAPLLGSAHEFGEPATEEMVMRRLFAAVALILGTVATAAAQEYPTRPISMVVAFPPGGVADNTARPVGAALERILKQPVAIINKAGAAGAVRHQNPATNQPHSDTPLMGPGSPSALPPSADSLS